MKIKIFLISLFLFSFISKNYGQFTFGVTPGFSFNGAYFGYKMNGKLVPYIGFQFVNINGTTTVSRDKYDWQLNKIIKSKDESKISGSLYLPNIGIKYFFLEKNKLKSYFNLSLSKPILNAKSSDNGKNDEEFEDGVDKISMIGGEFGFGIEYFFDENFSMGGEFGLRYFHLNYENSYEDEVYDPNFGTVRPAEVQDEFNFNLSPTFSKISLNYYF